MTKRQPWPRGAETARIDAIAAATHGLESLRPILNGSSKDTIDLVRRVGLAADHYHQIIETLQLVDVTDEIKRPRV